MKQEGPNSVKGKKGKGKPDVGAFKKALPSGSSRAKGSKRSQPSQRSRRTGSPMNDEEEAESGEEEAAPSSEPPTTAESSDAAGAPDAMSLGAIIEEDEVAAAAEAPSAAAAPAAVVEAAAAAPEHVQDPQDLTFVYTAPSVFVLDFTTAAAGCYQINGWGARFTPPFVEQAQRGDVYELLVGDVALGRFQYAPVAEMAKPEDGFVNADGRLRVSSRNMGGETVHMKAGTTTVTLRLDVALSPPRVDPSSVAPAQSPVELRVEVDALPLGSHRTEPLSRSPMSNHTIDVIFKLFMVNTIKSSDF
jgi:hypothetical protein